MLSFLPGSVVGCISTALCLLNVMIWVPTLYLVTFVKVILPLAAWRRLWSPVLVWIAETWISEIALS